MVKGHSHTLYPGWLGTVHYQEGMTYDDLYQIIYSPTFPVSFLIGTIVCRWHILLYVAGKVCSVLIKEVSLFQG